VRPRSLTARIIRSTVFVSLVTALAGAATATLLVNGLWRANERRLLHDLAAGLEEAVEREAAEEGTTPATAAAEALRESVTVGHRAEVWKGQTLVAASLPGPVVGPPDPARRVTQDRWLIATRPLRDGMLLVVASPSERGDEALLVFLWSLLFSAPVCLVLAVFIGRLAGRRVARPLLEFRDRIAAARPFDLLPAAEPSGIPEVAELETSFRGLWVRLRQAAAREVEFSANASHELRTPLTRIRLHAERAGAAAGAAPAAELRDLVAEVDRMARLVDSLLVLSRDAAAGIPAGEVINVSDLVDATARRVFAGATPPAIEAPDEALVRGDEALLVLALENLLDNARKFSSPGQPPRVRVEDDGASVRLTVTSPGARIPGEVAERLFERFYRGPEARASIPGHGLGLPLARHVARLHGGEVRGVSRPDEDARFELTLPAWRARSPKTDPATPVAAGRPASH
jgi:signal transduction histidine kinase